MSKREFRTVERNEPIPEGFERYGEARDSLAFKAGGIKIRSRSVVDADAMRDVFIEKNVPIPRQGAGRPPVKYPRFDMDVGDSVFFPEARQPDVATVYQRRGKLVGQKYTTRRVEGGVRVWRIA